MVKAKSRALLRASETPEVPADYQVLFQNYASSEFQKLSIAEEEFFEICYCYDDDFHIFLEHRERATHAVQCFSLDSKVRELVIALTQGSPI